MLKRMGECAKEICAKRDPRNITYKSHECVGRGSRPRESSSVVYRFRTHPVIVATPPPGSPSLSQPSPAADGITLSLGVVVEGRGPGRVWHQRQRSSTYRGFSPGTSGRQPSAAHCRAKRAQTRHGRGERLRG
jgi:hypothetical protein